MANVKLNPILKGLHGRIGNIVFYSRKYRDCVRIYVKGRDPNTEAQRAVRSTFGDAVKAWQALAREERFEFNRKAAILPMSGYNLFISEYIKTRIIAYSKPDSGNNVLDRIYTSTGQRQVNSVSPPFIGLLKERWPLKTLQSEPG